MTKPRQPRRGETPAPRVPASKIVPRQTANTPGDAIERRDGGAQDLKLERDRLAAELATAKAEIVRLEKARTEAVNRIDWVIENLTTALEQKS